MPNNNSNLNFLVVNNYSRFASLDVWDAFLGALKNDLGYRVMAYPIDSIQAFFSDDMIHHHLVSTAVSTRNNFTHVIFIGSSFLRKWVPETIRKMGVKVIYWSMEDPHAFDQNGRFVQLADYYFSNEKNVSKLFPNTFYLPTAGGHIVCRPPEVPLSALNKEDQEIFNNDVIFCGNVYPNRRELFEQLIPGFEKNKIKFRIIGITKIMGGDANCPIKKYVIPEFDGLTDHRIVIMAYGYAKFSINCERDPNFVYDERFSTNRLHHIEGYSLNPRAYEMALSGGALQLIDDKRKEIFDEGILEPDKHCVVYKSADDLIEKVMYYRAHEDERLAIVKAAREHALKNHTYKSRAQRMINIINLKEGRKDHLAANVLKNLFSKK